MIASIAKVLSSLSDGFADSLLEPFFLFGVQYGELLAHVIDVELVIERLLLRYQSFGKPVTWTSFANDDGDAE
jgi:hypothetical protein